MATTFTHDTIGRGRTERTTVPGNGGPMAVDDLNPNGDCRFYLIRTVPGNQPHHDCQVNDKGL